MTVTRLERAQQQEALALVWRVFLEYEAPDYPPQGVGRALFERLLADSPRGALTVNSSPYAVEVYRALGFRKTAEEQSVDGIRFTPMEYVK